jgi:tetratricopeptide (TPR) repeat protein
VPPTPSTASSPTPAGSRSAGAPPLVGRGAALHELEIELARAVESRGALVLVSGEPGIGKTRLVEELSFHAGNARTVLWASCWEDAGAPAYWPWIQLLRGLAAARGIDIVRSAGHLADEIVRLVPELDAGVPAPEPIEVAPDQARFRLFDAVSAVFRAAAANAPLVLALEDLHWADEGSLLLLRFMARELQTTQILVVGTYRDIEIPTVGAFSATLADVVARSIRIPLGPLDLAEVRELVEAMTGVSPRDDTLRRIHDRSGGNPLFVRELCRLLDRERGDRDFDVAIPEGVRAVIDRRLARLPQPSHELLSAASVLGADFDVTVVSGMAQTSEREVLDLLDAPTASRVVTPRSVPGRYCFSHALIRDALYSGLPTARRMELHHRAARALESAHRNDLDACAAELAHHYLQALPKADVASAVGYSIRAARRAHDQLAFEDAAAHYRRALEIVPPGDEGRRAELLLALGDAELAGGNLEQARSVFDDAAALARRRDRPEELARAALGFGAGLGGFEVRLWDQQQIDLLEESLAALPDEDSALRAWVLARLSVALSFVESERSRQDVSRRAVDMARRIDDTRALAYALSSLCDAIAGPDHVDERLALATEMVGLGRASHDRQMELLGRRFRVLAFLEQGDIASVDTEIEAFARLAETLGQPLYTCYTPVFRGMRAVMQGRFADAEALAGEADAIGQRGGSLNATILAVTVLAWVHREQGRSEVAERLMREAIGVHHEYEDYPATRVQFALLAADQGRLTPAHAALAELGSDDFARVPKDSEWLETMANAAELCALDGDTIHAAPLYKRLLPHAGRFAVDAIAGACFGSISRHLGMLAAMMGHWSDAERHFADARDDHERVGAPCLVADTKRNHGEMLLAYAGAGGRERAEQLLGEAAATYRALGADAQADRVDAMLGDASVPETAEAARGENVFRAEGKLWLLRYDGMSAHMRDAKGLRDVAALLAVPGRGVHVTELAAVTAGEPTLREGAGGDTAVLDGQARAEYRARLEELEAEVDEADAANDIGRASRAREERDFLAGELAGALGLGGRSRRLGDPIERARKAVGMRIRLALDRMEEVHPALARHLRNSVHTGTFCVYKPERPTVWSS